MGTSARSVKSYDEVAEEMGISVREVKLIEKRGLQKLRNYVRANDESKTLRNTRSSIARRWLTVLQRYWEDG